MNSFFQLMRVVRRRSSGWLACTCTVVALSTLTAASTLAAVASEHKLKSAFLYNFTKFIEWPPDRFATSSAPLVIALMADKEMTSEMSAVVADRLVNGRSVSVRRVTTPEDLRGIHILFVSSVEHARFMSVREEISLDGVLTVGEEKECVVQGGSICFRQHGEKLRFEINVGVAERSQLKISAHLQKLAIAVHRG